MKGRKLDVPGTEAFYSRFYSPAKGKSRRRAILQFVDYFGAQTSAGRVAVPLKSGMREFAARFGSVPPKGSKVAFIPRSLSRVSLKGKRPRILGKKTVTTVFFLDFVTDEWVRELAELEESPDELAEAIEAEVSKFVLRLPDAAVYSVTLATGDYAKGSTFSKSKLTDFLVDLILRFIKSKGTDELQDFAVAVNAVSLRKKKRKKTTKKKRRK